MNPAPLGRHPFDSPGVPMCVALLASASCLAIALAWFSWPILVSLHLRWVGLDYSHGYLIIGMSAWLVFSWMRQGLPESMQPSWAGVGLAALVMAVISVGNLSTTLVLSQAGLPALFLAVIWAVAGRRNALYLAGPIALLYFSIPVWDLINGQLRSLTVFVVSSWLRFAKTPAFIDGNMIFVPSGSFEVADGCSGLHFLIVGLALGAYFGLARHRRRSSRAALLGLALLASLFANWVRVFAIVLAGYLTQMQHYLVAQDHYYFGWGVFFVFCLIPLALLDAYLSRSGASGAAGSLAVEEHGFRRPGPPSRNHSVILASLAALCFGAAFLQSAALGGQAHGAASIDMPEISGWRELEEWTGPSVPVFVGADASEARRFSDGNSEIGLFVASYLTQGVGREVIYFANRPEGYGSTVLAASSRIVQTADGNGTLLTEMEVSDPETGARLVWLGRRIGGRWVASPLAAKMYQVLGALTGRYDALVVVLSAACVDSCDAARPTLSRFLMAGPGLLATAPAGSSR